MKERVVNLGTGAVVTEVLAPKSDKRTVESPSIRRRSGYWQFSLSARSSDIISGIRHFLTGDGGHQSVKREGGV